MQPTRRAMTKFNISVVSDAVCPWCYVGKRRMDAAIVQYKEKHPNSNDTFAVEWRPFYLDPNSPPKQSSDKREFFDNLFGPQRTTALFQRLDMVGKEVGINFKHGGKVGSSRDAHRMIHLAKTKGEDTQNAVVQNLFSAYFENEQDITKDDVLRKAAVDGGLDAAEVTDVLSSNKLADAVDNEVARASREAIHGVPHFSVNGKPAFSGAQDTDAFVQFLERVKAQEGS
ncbi:hypothetical protein FH972_023404 [Carpinus fangiana]|uniref:DSBA-like thioredoxin domain-containing protein n=1 Tax=Carpinus fangiana TaxID=176857 RepID=A0A5N6KVF3_9ROSI|nr:hypothetical protein FH972_023404 [Carpinus fangiana]